MKQIDEKNYAKKYIADNRQLFKIGVNFSSETRCIDSFDFLIYWNFYNISAYFHKPILVSE